MQGDLYLFGGVKGTVIMKDLWKYNIASNTWSSLDSGPRNISGHTSHVVNGKMLVIFGYSPDYGYSNEVFEYNIGKFFYFVYFLRISFSPPSPPPLPSASSSSCSFSCCYYSPPPHVLLLLYLLIQAPTTMN